MKKLALLPLVAALLVALTISAPASADPGRDYRHGPTYHRPGPDHRNHRPPNRRHYGPRHVRHRDHDRGSKVVVIQPVVTNPPVVERERSVSFGIDTMDGVSISVSTSKTVVR
jgi:hypothetical protein